MVKGLPSGTVTFLFTDIEGSTGIVRELGEPGLTATCYVSPASVTWAAGVHVAVVEVDRETGGERADEPRDRIAECEVTEARGAVRGVREVAGRTLASASTMEPSVRAAGSSGTVAAAKAVGERVGERAKQAGVDTVVFDRGGFKYHGRVAAVADGARGAGLEF